MKTARLADGISRLSVLSCAKRIARISVRRERVMFEFFCGLFIGAWAGLVIYAIILAGRDDK